MNIISIIITAILFSGTGYYVGRRSIEGVKVDLNNAKLEVEHLKDRLSGKAQANSKTGTSETTSKKESPST